jgi:hypothetical protein
VLAVLRSARNKDVLPIIFINLRLMTVLNYGLVQLPAPSAATMHSGKKTMKQLYNFWPIQHFSGKLLRLICLIFENFILHHTVLNSDVRIFFI